MTILRNLAPNPSIETAATGWAGWVAAVAVARVAAVAHAAVGGSFLRATATAATTNFGAQTTLPAEPGTWAAAVLARTTVAGAVGRIRFGFLNASGTLIGSYQYTSTAVPVPTSGYGRITITGTAPAGTVSVQIVVYLAASPAAVNGLAVDAGALLDVDALIVTTGTEAPAYFDGDSPGWAWDGPPHASPSRGTDQPYTPDGELLLAGSRIDWLDLVPGFDEQAQSASVVQIAADAPARAPWITVRPARDGRGTLTMHFTAENGYGLPGDRAERVARSLRTGAPHVLQLRGALHGLTAPLTLTPVGQVRRTREARSEQAWTVAFDFYRDVTP